MARRQLGVLLVAALMVGAWGVARSGAEVVDLTLVRTQEAVHVLDTATGAVTARVPGGEASPDGAVVVRVLMRGAFTRLAAVEAGTGEELWRRDVDGQWAVRLVGADGQTVVLGPVDGEGIYAPVPRARTPLLVTGPDGEPRRFDLAGNYEPEALALDGQSVFVISYLPPTAPDRYQVRRLDRSLGEVVDVFTPDAHLQEAMGGTARTQLWAPDGTRLYTLYTLAEGDGEHAFVHVLDLEELWAHCIDLPGGMATADESAVALALGPDDRLYVADRAWRRLAEVDTASLAVVRTAALPAADGFEAHAAGAPDGRLFLASGRQVDVLDHGTLEPLDRWHVDGEVAGLRLTHAGDALVAVLRDRRLVVLDAVSGEPLDTFTVPGDLPVDAVGGSSKRVPPPREAFDCAC